MAPSLAPIATQFVGALLIGTYFNFCLYGLLLIQTHAYYRRFQGTDPIWIRSLVGFSFTISTVSACLCGFCSYFYGVTNFGDVNAMFIEIPPFSALVLSISLASGPVQIFFGWRVKRLTGHAWLLWFCIAAGLVQIGCAVAAIIVATPLHDFRLFYRFQYVIVAWQGTASVTDSLITVILVKYLRDHRTGNKATDDMLRRLTRLTIHTGLVTTLFAIAGMSLFVGFKNNYDFMFNTPLPQLYANCLLSSLNSRTEWSDGKSQHSHPRVMPQNITVTRTVETEEWAEGQDVRTFGTSTTISTVLNLGRGGERSRHPDIEEGEEITKASIDMPRLAPMVDPRDTTRTRFEVWDTGDIGDSQKAPYI